MACHAWGPVLHDATPPTAIRQREVHGILPRGLVPLECSRQEPASVRSRTRSVAALKLLVSLGRPVMDHLLPDLGEAARQIKECSGLFEVTESELIANMKFEECFYIAL
jgi:hypothetical protein